MIVRIFLSFFFLYIVQKISELHTVRHVKKAKMSFFDLLVYKTVSKSSGMLENFLLRHTI